jgi:hypothetical protein
MEQFTGPRETPAFRIKRTGTLRGWRDRENQKKFKNLKPGFPVLWEAVLAINRSSLGRLKWYFAIFTAV